MPTLEETQTRLSYEVAIYREQMTMLQKEIERVSLTTLDLSNAAKTVKDIKQDSMLVPVGGGAYIKGKVEDANVIVPIGAQYLLEMSREEAITEISRRMDSTKKAVNRLNAEFQKISTKLKEVAVKLRSVEEHSKISKRVEESAREDYI